MAGFEQDRNATDWSRAIHTQHPEIGGELQNAINTLRKLQRITGTMSPEPKGPFQVDAGAVGIDATLPPQSGTGVLETQDSAPRASQEVRLLAERENFGRYQIVRLLGRGAMGAVYLAYDPQLERYVALKTPSLGGGSDVVQRFYREVRAAAKLRSPYICTIYDVAQLGVIHRDLKPDNVMIDADGRPIVMDFGLAREAKDLGTITSPGAMLGTPAYMSPEQVEGDQSKIGPATDIYSLGVVLFEMLTGRLPFQGSLMSVLQQIGRDDPPRPSSLVPEIPAGSPLEEIYLKMMSKSPGDRFASMAQVAEAIDGARQVGNVPPPRIAWRRKFVLALSRPLLPRGWQRGWPHGSWQGQASG